MIAPRLIASWAAAPPASLSPSAAATPMLAAAGIVVTEISTPTRAPDLAEVSESTPAAPASAATITVKWSGFEMNCGERVAVLGEPVRDQAGRVEQKREQEARPDRERKADQERGQRAPDQVAALLDDGDAEPGERPELRPDDHRADDQDQRVGEDPHRGDQGRQDHEREEARRELDVLRGARLDLLPDHGVGWAARWPPPRLVRELRRSCESMSSIAIDPSLSISSSLRSETITLASSRAMSTRITSPSGRCAARSRKIRLQAEGVCSSRSSACPDWWLGTTIRRCTMCG